MVQSPIQALAKNPMFTWISKPSLALALLSISACAGIDIGGASRAVSVQGGAISVAPPPNYCADPKFATDGSGSAVVLMGRCTASSSAHPAVITASVGGDGTGAALDAGPVALTSFFTSDTGRAMLASSGKAGDAIVQASEVEDGAVVLRIKDISLGEYWRAIMALRGRLVMLSATGAGRLALPVDEGRNLISKSMASLRRANPDPLQKQANGGLFAALAAPTVPDPAPDVDEAAEAAPSEEGAP